jgi:hypothetical protein
VENKNGNSNFPDPLSLEFHYDLERQNRETVRRQAELINKNLKKIKASVTGKRREDEPTEQFVTKPTNITGDTCLKEALEEVRKSLPPPEALATLPAKKKKRWFSWSD